ncbi:MAG: hypothetical protein ACRYG5_19355 [Janthinobacterium lividum]
MHRKIAAALIAVAAVTSALPAQAQVYQRGGGGHGGPGFRGGDRRGGGWHGGGGYRGGRGGYRGGGGGGGGLVVGALLGVVAGAAVAGAVQQPPPPPPGAVYYPDGNPNAYPPSY